jgi:hypothetical protein
VFQKRPRNSLLSLSPFFFKYISVALVTRRKVYVCVYLSLYIITRGGVYYFALTIEHKDQKREMLERMREHVANKFIAWAGRAAHNNRRRVKSSFLKESPLCAPRALNN